MTGERETPGHGTADRRTGVAYAVAAAVAAGLLLLLPLLMLGTTLSVIASVGRGDVVAWVSSVGMTYVFVGVPALISILLLVIPRRVLQVAASRLGAGHAIRWAGGALAAWHAGVALLWVRGAAGHSTPVSERAEFWYAVAFAIAALVTVALTAVAAKHAVRAGIALGGGLTVGLLALVAVLVSLWGTPPRIPPTAQTAYIVVTSAEVHLEPATLRAGDVYFVLEEPDAEQHGGGFAFVHAGYGSPCCDTPIPLTDDHVDRIEQGDYQGTNIEGGWGEYTRLTLRAGNYVFLSGGGGEPGVPPESITVLEVLP
ncbi:MAG: hypothetical protein ACXWWL_01860 [Candidatus Limnocylindria bacterium]